MNVFNILSIVLILVTLLLIIYRVFKEMQLRGVEKTKEQTLLFRQKLEVVRQKQYRLHVMSLLWISFFFLLILCLILFSLIQIEQDNSSPTIDQTLQTPKLSDETSESNRLDFTLDSSKEDFVSDLLIEDYPNEGLGLKEYAWKEFIDDSENLDKQFELEMKMDQELIPYFGFTQTMIVLNQSTKSLDISLMFDIESESQEERVLANLKALITEAEEVEPIVQVNVQLINVSNPDLDKNEYYIRDNPKEKFEKLDNPMDVKGAVNKDEEKDEQKGAVNRNE